MVCGSGLELYNLNLAMNGQGFLVGNQLRFYTMALLYGVTFGPSGAYGIERYNKALGYWESVQFSGTYKQTISTLTMFEPFLTTAAEVNEWWTAPIPPEDPTTLSANIFFPGNS